MMTGMTVTERKRSRRQPEKPKPIQFVLSSTYPNSSAALLSLQTANPLNAFHHSVISRHCILPSLTCSPSPYFLFFSLSSVPSHPSFSIWFWADLNCPPPFPLCYPASYESHGGQGPRGCQGLLMTPSPTITSG